MDEETMDYKKIAQSKQQTQRKPQPMAVDKDKLVRYIQRLVEQKVAEALPKAVRAVLIKEGIVKPKTKKDVLRERYERTKAEMDRLKREMNGEFVPPTSGYDALAEGFAGSEDDDPDAAIINEYVRGAGGSRGARSSGLISTKKNPKLERVKAKAETDEERMYAQMLEETQLIPEEIMQQQQPTMAPMGYQGMYDEPLDSPAEDPRAIYQRAVQQNYVGESIAPQEQYQPEQPYYSTDPGYNPMQPQQELIEGVAQEFIPNLDSHRSAYNHGMTFVEDDVEMIRNMQHFMVQSVQQQKQHQQHP